MSVLLVQIFLLVLGAFLVGAMTACLFRRLLRRLRTSVPLETPDPTGGGARRTGAGADAATSSADAARFERALAGSAVPPQFQASTDPMIEVQNLPDPGHAGLHPAPAPDVVVPPPQSISQPPRVEPVPMPTAAAEPVGASGGIASTAAAVATGAATAAEAAAAAVSVNMESDDLTLIRSIDDETARRLNSMGILRFSDIAAWTEHDVTRYNQSLGFYGRIEQENWIGQAHILSGGGETAYSESVVDSSSFADNPGSASPSAEGLVGLAADHEADSGYHAETSMNGDRDTNFTNFRSVRSEALVGNIPPPLPTDLSMDDLKRIRGIGVLIEKRLNALGISNYEQIANWTGADIERISELLDFKGRIQREHWIEQARILASGGQTEFSQRADRGDA